MIRKHLKKIFNPIINRRPSSGLSADNLYAYLDAIYKLKNIDGAIVEIGVAGGGTTGTAINFMNKIKSEKEYFCIDTFSGFVKKQVEEDVELGMPKNNVNLFSDNSQKLFESNLKRWGILDRVNILKGDIAEFDDDNLPENISLCLLDVDLKDPIYKGLQILFPKMSNGGIILVDDCKKGTSWVGANKGYLNFIEENNLKPIYFMGFGVVFKGEISINWETQTSLN